MTKRERIELEYPDKDGWMWQQDGVRKTCRVCKGLWTSAMIALEVDGPAKADAWDIKLDLFVLMKSASEYARAYIEDGRQNLQFPFTVQEVVDANVAKLESRRRRGVIHGKGDNR